ncbi:MAG: LacI family DNA-binding transcriptional regulator, partial [Pseudomonadota bacterium]
MARTKTDNSAKMKDVADLAGVSIKTVSRVLNNEPHVQEKLRRKVREAADKLDYVPSQSARSLRGSRSYDINLVCHHPDSAYVNAIQFGAVIACQ